MTSKIIVIDANILIRAVLGIRTFSLIEENSTAVQFCTPSFAIKKLLIIFLILLKNAILAA